MAGEIASLVRYFSGGSCELFYAPNGSVGATQFIGPTIWAGASLVALQGNGYMITTTEIVNLNGPCRYYLLATGATCVLMHIRGLSPGF